MDAKNKNAVNCPVCNHNIVKRDLRFVISQENIEDELGSVELVLMSKLKNTNLADSYFDSTQVNEENYLKDIERIIHEYSIDVILPQNTLELPILSKKKKYFYDMGVAIVISDHTSIKNANNKTNYDTCNVIAKPMPRNTWPDIPPSRRA